MKPKFVAFHKVYVRDLWFIWGLLSDDVILWALGKRLKDRSMVSLFFLMHYMDEYFLALDIFSSVAFWFDLSASVRPLLHLRQSVSTILARIRDSVIGAKNILSRETKYERKVKTVVSFRLKWDLILLRKVAYFTILRSLQLALQPFLFIGFPCKHNGKM